MCSALLASPSSYAHGIKPCFLFHHLSLDSASLMGWNRNIVVLAPKVTVENVYRGAAVGHIEMICSSFSAVWNDSSSYPTSWQLDATEGPNRERRRLQRCYLTIPNKYLLRDRRKPEGEEAPPTASLRPQALSTELTVLFRPSKGSVVLPVRG